MQFLSSPVSGTGVPPHAMATTTGCLDADDQRAWSGVVPEADHHAVYLMNYGHVHTETNSELTQTTNNSWVFEITVTPDWDESEVPDECQSRALNDATIVLPPSAETLPITIGGDVSTVIDMTTRSPRSPYLED